MGDASDIGRLTEALALEGIEYRGVEVVPFSSALPDITSDRPTICYGSTTFITACRDRGPWVPGVWHDDDNFTWRAWAKHLGDLLINNSSSCELTTIREFVTT